MQPITVVVDRKLSDYVEAYTTITKPLLRLAVAVLFLGLALWVISAASRYDDILLGVLGGAELAFGFMMLWSAYSCTWATPRKMYRAHQQNSFQEYRLSDDGIGITTGVGNSFTKWTAFAKILETRSLWILYLANTLFYILPKRCVSADRLTELREVLHANVRAPARSAVGPG